ncbi:hypothetical protein [Enterococcus sp. DIV1852]
MTVRGALVLDEGLAITQMANFLDFTGFEYTPFLCSSGSFQTV